MEVKPLDELYPLCKRFGLIMNYRMDVGAFVTCAQAEAVLHTVLIIAEFNEQKIKDMEKEFKRAYES